MGVSGHFISNLNTVGYHIIQISINFANMRSFHYYNHSCAIINKEKEVYIMNATRQAIIYVGLNDAITHMQKFETEKYLSLLKKVCHSYHVAFSVNVINGGYFHEDGTYVEENTLNLTLLDVPDETVQEIAKDLCAFFHQESVMVSYADCKVHFISESLE